MRLICAVRVDGLKYWQEAASDGSTNQDAGTWRAPYERARSVDIEMTAYGLLTYVLNGDFSGAVSIAKWLVSQRNSLGGFSSTQVRDTSASFSAAHSNGCCLGDGGGGHWLVRMERRPDGWSLCPPLLIFHCTIKSRSSLLAPAHLGGPGKRAVKRLWCGGGVPWQVLVVTSVSRYKHN